MLIIAALASVGDHRRDAIAFPTAFFRRLARTGGELRRRHDPLY
jgi:hypothetical protein